MTTELVPSTLSAGELARAHNALDPSAPAEQVAMSAIASLRDMAVRLIAIELLTASVEQVRRAEVRPIERASVTSAVVRSMTRSEEQAERVGDILAAASSSIGLTLTPKFLAIRFRVDGEWTTHGTATAEQHEARATRLATLSAGINDTMAMHLAEARMIRAAHALNLNDVAARRR